MVLFLDSFYRHFHIGSVFECSGFRQFEDISSDVALLGNFLHHVVFRSFRTANVSILLAVPAGNQRKVHD